MPTTYNRKDVFFMSFQHLPPQGYAYPPENLILADDAIPDVIYGYGGDRFRYAMVVLEHLSRINMNLPISFSVESNRIFLEFNEVGEVVIEIVDMIDPHTQYPTDANYAWVDSRLVTQLSMDHVMYYIGLSPLLSEYSVLEFDTTVNFRSITYRIPGR
jgi:hypothetical protein